MTLKEVRKMRGLTQVELATLVGISDSHLNRIELGRLWPKENTRQKIENALNHIPDWYATYWEQKQYPPDLIFYQLNQYIKEYGEQVHLLKSYIDRKLTVSKF
jgi:transcriptional regulator with XRE-family HTH domain